MRDYATRQQQNMVRPITPKDVMVVGSGPAGMETARIAAERGHRVTLYEKNDRLGGQLYAAAAGHGKQDVDEFRKYLEIGLARTGVKTKLGTAVDADLVKEVKPDALVVAVGGKANSLNVPGAEGENVVSPGQAITGEKPVGQKVLVIGGGMVGMETAEHLAEQGHTVNLIELETLIADMSMFNRPAMLDNVAMAGVITYEHADIQEITAEGARVKIDGKDRFFEADTIVLSIGSASNEAFLDSVKDYVPEIIAVGDASGNSRFREAVIEGHAVGRAL